jgi:hypothetical protein
VGDLLHDGDLVCELQNERDIELMGSMTKGGERRNLLLGSHELLWLFVLHDNSPINDLDGHRSRVRLVVAQKYLQGAPIV